MSLKKIFVVNNNAEDRDLIVEIINQLDPSAATLTISSGSVLLKVLAGYKEPFGPTVVILDMRTPLLNVPQVIERIRSERRYDQIEIVVLTASLYQEQYDLFMRTGANRIFIKPAKPSEFKVILKHILSYSNITDPSAPKQPI